MVPRSASVPEWHDGPEVDALQETLGEALAGHPEHMPAQCPLCHHAAVHAYFHGHPGRTLGGSWVWCGACRAFTHGTIRIPAWWVNLEAVELSILTATPVALDSMTARIDAHWNSLRRGG